MSIATTIDAVTLLRGKGHRRPHVDRALCGGLRAWLDDEYFALFGNDTITRISRSPWTLTHGQGPSSTLSLARSALVMALCTQRLLGATITHPMDDALSVLESDVTQTPLTYEIHHLEPERFSLLAAEVAAHDEVLAQQLRSVPGAWLPRFHLLTSLALHGEQVSLTAMTDVMFGPPPKEIASVALLDITTTTHDDHITNELRIRALLETLRSGVQPFAVASLSSATGSLALLEVQEADLVEGVHLCVAGIKAALHG